MIICVCSNINERTAREFLKDHSIVEFFEFKGLDESCFKCMKTLQDIENNNGNGKT